MRGEAQSSARARPEEDLHPWGWAERGAQLLGVLLPSVENKEDADSDSSSVAW